MSEANRGGAGKPAHGTRISDDAVRAKTGRGWDEWFARLDAVGATRMDHAAIARHLSEQEGVPPWWAQMVTVSYEQARGMRQKHQKSDGFSANISRTVAAPLDALFAAWADDPRRAAWLEDPGLTIRKATPSKSMRITWPDGTAVDVYFYAKGDAKSQVALEHRKLPDADAVQGVKDYWTTQLDRLQQTLAAGG